MFRGSHSPHRQPLLDEQPQAPSPTPRKTTASSIRNFFFGKDNDEHHESTNHPQGHGTVDTSPEESSYSSSETAPDTATSPPQPPMKATSRDRVQRANSHPLRLDASAALSASHAFDPSMSRAAALDVGGVQSTCQRGTTPRHQQPQQQSLRQSPTFAEGPDPPSLRSTVYGSCSHVLSTVIRVLVQVIKTHHEYIEPATTIATDGSTSPLDKRTVRKTKLLYIALLERAQKERGEWQGFISADDATNTTRNTHDDDTTSPDESVYGLLTATLGDTPKEETFVILNELLELSLRNLRVSVVPPSVYAQHRNDLLVQSLGCPASLETLICISNFAGDLSRDERRCVLHLLNFWVATCVVSPDTHELRRFVEDKHMLVLSESSDTEFMPVARRSMWSDPVAVDLLTVMGHYRELIFSDLEFYKIRHEMQIAPESPTPVLLDASPAAPGLSAHANEPEVGQDAVVEPTVPDRPGLSDDQRDDQAIASPRIGQPTESAIGLAAPAMLADGDAASSSMLIPMPVSPVANSHRSLVGPLPTPSRPKKATKIAQRRPPSSPSAADTTTRVKSPRTTVISPRVLKARHYHIHAAPPSTASSTRRASRSRASVDVALSYVAVALASASLGVLATLAFSAVRRSSQ